LGDLQLHIDSIVEKVFKEYPDEVYPKMIALRDLIIESVEELEDVTHLEETLKWGEPSYLTKKGSTIRMDWKSEAPTQYAIYFKCTSALVPTFREVYQGLFDFEGNRAIVFQMKDSLPTKELKNCIKAALRYHKVKQLTLLGM